MSKLLINNSSQQVEIAFASNHVVFDPGESKEVADDFPEEGLAVVGAEAPAASKPTVTAPTAAAPVKHSKKTKTKTVSKKRR